MDEELKDEIETIESVYDDTELTITYQSDAKLLNIIYILKLDEYAKIIVKFKCDYSSSMDCSISVANEENSRKIIPSDLIQKIQNILIQKYNEEKDSMPIFQCLSYCNDELMDDEKLNLAAQLKSIRVIADPNEYLKEMDKYRDKCQKNKKARSKRNDDEKKKDEATEFGDDGSMSDGVKALLECNPNLKEAIPSVNQVRSWLQTTFNAHGKFQIRFIGNTNIVRQFLNSNNQSNKFSVVYHGTSSYNDANIINKGLITGGTKGVPIATGRAHGKGIYCSPNINVANGYANGSIFICLIRDNGTKKSGDIYVVQSDDDILPLYLASGAFKFSSNRSGSSGFFVNNKIMKFHSNFYGNERNKNRRLLRKWSAYHKLSS